MTGPKPESTFGNAWLPCAGIEKGNGRGADVPASGIDRMRPVTVLACGFETIRVSLLAATKETTVAAEARMAITRAISATPVETRCTNPRRWRRVWAISFPSSLPTSRK